MTNFSTVVATYPAASLAERAVEHLVRSGIAPGNVSIATMEQNPFDVPERTTGSKQSQGPAYLVVVAYAKREAPFAKDLLQGTQETFHTVHGERVMEQGS